MIGSVMAILVMLLCLFIPLLVIVAIVNAINKKNSNNNSNNKTESFEKNVRTIYLYIMLIIFLCAIIGGVLCSVEYALDLFLPQEEFGKYVKDLNRKNEITTDLITSISVFAISLPMFIYHNNLIKKIKEEK